MTRPATASRLLALAAAVAASFAVPSARAEEAGTGHYLPGQTASFIDAMPGKPGLALLSLGTWYDGDASVALPIAGLATAGVEATIYANTFGFVYTTQKRLFGGEYSYAAAMPLVDLTVKGSLNTPLGVRRVRDQETGIGDLMLFPVILGWTALEGDLKYDVRLGVYAPTGSYEAGKLANLGKNFWTFEPSASVSWISHRIGLEASAFTGFDINTTNTATDYESGSSWHFEGTLAEHLPILGGIAGLGASGFAYVQITDDGGSGATLGDFRGHTVGVGPVASYIHEGESATVAGELKWLPELDTDKRLRGDFVWLKIAASF